jgi:hypothetical protein
MKQHDSIMVVMDKLTKASHFILVKKTYKATNIAKINMKEVARLHGVPKEIVSNIDPNFVSKFWKDLFEGFGRNLNLSTTYHPELVGKKRTNGIIQDQPSKWEDYIHLVEFYYNNGYHASLKMS